MKLTLIVLTTKITISDCTGEKYGENYSSTVFCMYVLKAIHHGTLKYYQLLMNNFIEQSKKGVVFKPVSYMYTLHVQDMLLKR